MSCTIHRLPASRLSNEAVGVLEPAEKATMIEAAAGKLEELFDILQLDTKNDHNMQETPMRVARMCDSCVSFIFETSSSPK